MPDPIDLFPARIAKAIAAGEVDALVRERAARLGMEMGRCCHGRLLDAECKRCEAMTSEINSQ